ncbi:MAG: hypothetical protein PHE68_01740 [Candidatus Peribacteraceae bacterium]|nr:hypothetical protein [Candidatus Peribacteraceae bacterium]
MSSLRRFFLYGLITLSLGGMVGMATAAELMRVDDATDFQTVEQTIEKLKQDMEKSMCGAWDFEQHLKPVGGGTGSAGSAASGETRIIRVEGFPGREGKVFGAAGSTGSAGSSSSRKIPLPVLKSGLANREENAGNSMNGFLFPENTTGVTTACEVDKKDVQTNCVPKFPYIHDPYYDGDPSCIARQDLDPPPPNGAFEKRCTKICDEMNNWIRDVIIDNRSGDFVWKAERCRRQGCEWKGDEQGRAAIPEHGEYPQCFDYSVDPPEDHCTTTMVYCCTDAYISDIENANCIPCQGDGTNQAEGGCRVGKYAYPNNAKYVSFYRKYVGSFKREKVEKKPEKDVNEMKNLIVKCYSRYTEFDPKLQRTTPPDRHCVLDLESSSARSATSAGTSNLEIFRNMKDTQKGLGKKWGQDSNFRDPAYSSSSRPTLNDLWVTNLGGAFSMLNGEKQEEQFKDAPLTLLSLDSTSVIPTAQMTEDIVFSSGSLMRAFDDTISISNPGGGVSTGGMNYERPGRRTITEWWQEQETEMHKLFTPPILRVLLPTPQSENLVFDHPLLNPAVTSRDRPRATDQQSPGVKAIDIQLHAAPDDLAGEVSSYLMDSLLLHIEEEPVTVVVPLASPVELRALAQGWRSWGKEREALDEDSGEAEAIAAKLEKYANKVDDVRALRGELLQYVGKLLKFQKDMMSSITNWHNSNTSALDSYNSRWQERFALKPKWEGIQRIYRKFNDETNFPWCRNDRFTTPVYSLLDYWMPKQSNPRDLALDIDAPPSEGSSADDLPRIRVAPMPDLVYDFTMLRVASGTVKLPVLKPMQIRLDLHLLRPPTFNQSAEELSDRMDYISGLPNELPAVPTIFKEVKDKLLPSEVIKSAPPTVLSESLDPPADYIEGEMTRMEEMLTKMDETHKKFWESLTEDRNASIDKWNCLTVDALPCIHVEMDLLERFARIGARPAVFLYEDFLSVGSRRPLSPFGANSSDPFFVPDPIKSAPPCPRADWSCQIVNAEKTKPRSGWHTEGPDNEHLQEDRQKLNERMRTETIPKNEDNAFPLVAPPNDLLPAFAAPAPYLFPTPLSSYPSSSSRSSP